MPLSELRRLWHLAKGRGSAKATVIDISKTIIDHVAIEDFREIDANRFSVDIGAKGGAFPKPMLDVGVIPHTLFEVRRVGGLDY